MTAPLSVQLSPSELGTKAYWDSIYSTDLSGTPSSPRSELPAWFSDVNASQKILSYITSCSLSLDRNTTSFLDLGTGNGEMLFLLREEGCFRGKMLGVDYSGPSVELCRRVAGSRGLEDNQKVDFEEWDVMRDIPREDWAEGFDVVMDKGTFDAVSLSGETDEQGRRMCEGYREKVERLVKKGGLILITSCNWTDAELKTWFTGGDLEAIGRVEYPIFSFGGKTGQSVCSVCFERTS